MITDTSGELDRINKKLDDHISGEKIQKDIVKTLLHTQQALQARIQQLQDCLTKLLQKKLIVLSNRNRIAKLFAPMK